MNTDSYNLSTILKQVHFIYHADLPCSLSLELFRVTYELNPLCIFKCGNSLLPVKTNWFFILKTKSSPRAKADTHFVKN